MEEGIKHDNEKLRFDLVPVFPMQAVAAVFTHGAAKYQDRNWEKGIDQGRLYAAALRHLLAFWGGETVDAESGLPHLAHAIVNCMMMIEMQAAFPSRDNRPRPSEIRKMGFNDFLDHFKIRGDNDNGSRPAP